MKRAYRMVREGAWGAIRRLAVSGRLLPPVLREMLIARPGLAMALPRSDLEASMASTVPTAGVPVTAAKRAKRQVWSPPLPEEFRARLDEALADATDRGYRTNLGLQCWTFMDRVWVRRTNAVHARSQWNLFRYAGAVIPVVAAGAGGSLVGHVHGTAGTVIGWVALIGGLVGAAINAVRPAVEYGVDLRKAAEFEQLYWDVFNYAMAELPTADLTAIPAKLTHFAQRMQGIAITSGGSSATSS